MRFSVALCTYNGAAYIQEQLNSILRQTVPVSEIIICDDNSRDGTAEIAERILGNAGISYQILINDPPLGVAENFLKAMKHTTGDYVFTCDQDDIWHENKVEIFRDAVQQSRKALYFSDGVLVDGDAKPLGSTLWEAYGVNSELTAGKPIMHILIRHPVVTGAAMVVSRQLIDQISYVPRGYLHDEWFAMAAAVQDSIMPVLQTTFDYRQHGTNVVGAKRLSLAERTQKWLSKIGKMREFRLERLKKITAVLKLAEHTPYEAHVREAVSFWEAMTELSEFGLFKGSLRIFEMYTAGKYRRFYTGFRGAVRDMLSCVIKESK